MRKFLKNLLFFLLSFVSAFGISGAVRADEYVVAKAAYIDTWYNYKSFDTLEALEAYLVTTCNSQPAVENCVITDGPPDTYMYSLEWSHHVILTWDRVNLNYPTQHLTDTRGIPVEYTCPTSWSYFSGDSTTGVICSRPTPIEIACSCKRSSPEPVPTVGDPILLGPLVTLQEDIDYSNASGTLSFIRTYRSDAGNWTNNFQSTGIDWNTNIAPATRAYSCYFDTSDTTHYCYKYTSISLPYNLDVRRGNQLIHFGNTTDYLPTRTDIDDRATPATDGMGNIIGWDVTNTAHDTIETYGKDGRLLKIMNRSGQATHLSYSDSATPIAIAPSPGLLISVTDTFGNALHLIYDDASRLVKLIDPDGHETTYAYDSSGRLTTVTHPDGNTKTYIYAETDKVINLNPFYELTGVVDENGSRFSTFYYNSSYVFSTEEAGGVNKFSITGFVGNRTVIDPLGTQRIYRFQDLTTPASIRKSTGVTQPAPSGSGSVTSNVTYDAQANVASKTDFAGVTTTFVYDLSRNLEISRVEAAGTAAARTISTAWHAQFRLPVTIAEPLKLTTNAYDTVGRLVSHSEQATSDASGMLGVTVKPIGKARTWTYTYNVQGQLLSYIGPRGDGIDVWTYTYDGHGNRTSATNPLGQVLTYSNFDGSGRPGQITQPNGLTTSLTYTPRGWLETATVSDGKTSQVTRYGYDAVGQLTRVISPDNAFLNYSYDPAHRLTDVSDNVGNHVHYTLDNAGNRVSDQVTDPSSALIRKISRTYDALNNLSQQTGGTQ